MASAVGVPVAKVNPRYLHSNSTSHTWAFSAIAELIDNAYDPDVKATHVDIDTRRINDEECLIIQDNGAGIETANLFKMLSFGFCDKDAITDSYAPIGHYGNGFKSGSMRLGKNALVFTRCENSTSVGFLSQTYLEAIEADTILVPILEYNKTNYRFKDDKEAQNCLEAILKYSVFHTEEELKEQLKTLEFSVTGTQIFIFNLNTSEDGMLELDLVSDPTDIRCPETVTYDMAMTARPVVQKPSDYRRSLRVYTSILYLNPRMKIILRGKPVRSKLVSRSLSKTERDTYRPTWLVPMRPIKIIFGFNCDMLDDYGMMLYHKNRLIKAYEKVGYQKQENELGVGVVGVAEVDFLEPIHNKQDFRADDSKYISLMKAFGEKLNDYWNEKIQGQTSQTPHAGREVPHLWAQCDTCLKWRRLPGESTKKSLPDKWFCFLNRDATHNRCDIPEEKEGEDEEVLKPSYKKTFKRKHKEEKQKEKKISQMKVVDHEMVRGLLRDIIQRQVSQPDTQNSKAHSLRLQSSSLKTSPEQTTAPPPTENQPADTPHMDDSNDGFQITPSKKPHLDQSIKHSECATNSLQLKIKNDMRNTEEDVAPPPTENQPADTPHMDDSNDGFQITPSKKPHLDQSIKHSECATNSLQLKIKNDIRNTEEDVAPPPTENQPADTSLMDDSDDDLQFTPSEKIHLDHDYSRENSKYATHSLQLAPSLLKNKKDEIRNIDVASPISSNQQDNYNTESYEQDEAQEISSTNDNKSESERGNEGLNGTETSPVGPSQIANISNSNDVPMEKYPSLTYPLARNERRNRESDESLEGQRTTQKVQVNEIKEDVRIKLEIADETTLTSCQSNSPRSGSQLLEWIEERFRKFRCNVKNLLAFMAPDVDVKDVNDIEILVEDLIKQYQESAKEEDDQEKDDKVDLSNIPWLNFSR